MIAKDSPAPDMPGFPLDAPSVLSLYQPSCGFLQCTVIAFCSWVLGWRGMLRELTTKGRLVRAPVSLPASVKILEVYQCFADNGCRLEFNPFVF
ncbi:UNVERIFIED_CONTAM: hypothetical protein Sangu_3020500 [Sesamum angustifolium]|uniref:Uncharacterized protein n=1 Tax=Sesamum angustifolium TaxID=2727405 RepID=A0AAW2KKW0_9LAMI